jgi:hypothetical protein
MERRSLIVYFDMRLEEDRELLQRLRPYIVSRRGNAFIKAAIREKFERVAANQVKTGGIGPRPPPTGEREPCDETEAAPVPSAQTPTVVPPSSSGGPEVSVAPPANATASEAARDVEAMKLDETADPHNVSTPEADSSVQAIAVPERTTPPRPRLGRLM